MASSTPGQRSTATAPRSDAATADEAQGTPLTIKVWHGEIVGADLGGTSHWAQGDPPGVAIPAAFLAVSLGLQLLVVRVQVHRRIRSRGSAGRRLLLDDLGQTVAASARSCCSHSASGQPRSSFW